MFNKKNSNLFSARERLGFYREILFNYKYHTDRQSLFGCLNLVYKSEKWLEVRAEAGSERFVKQNFPEFYAQKPTIIQKDIGGGWWPDGDYDSRIEAFQQAIALTEKSIKENGIKSRLRLRNVLKLLYRCIPGY